MLIKLSLQNSAVAQAEWFAIKVYKIFEMYCNKEQNLLRHHKLKP